MAEFLAEAFLAAVAVSETAVVLEVGSLTITAIEVATAVASVALTAGSIALSASALSGNSADPGAAQNEIRQPIPVRRRYYGQNLISGPVALYEARDGMAYTLLALCDGPIQAVQSLWLNDKIITVDGNGGVQEYPYQGIEAPFAPNVFVFTQLGTTSQTAIPRLTADLSDIWTSDHRLRGIATMLVCAGSVPPESFLKVFPGHLPKGRITGQFSLVYDPRLDGTNGGTGAHRIDTASTWAYSANSALVILDYIRHNDGMRVPSSYFSGVLPDWASEAAIAAETVALKAGGTTPRWQTHGGYDFNEQRADVLGRMLESCDGWLFLRPDGKIGLNVGKYREPTVTFTDADILDYEIVRAADALSVANTIQATYISPLHNYERVEAERWVDATDVVLRGTKEARLDLTMVQGHSQARRLMKRAAIRAKPVRQLNIKTTIAGMQAQDQRYVRVQIAELDSLDAVFERTGLTIDLSTMTCAMSLREIPSTLDTWDAASEEGTEPPVPDDLGASTGPVPSGLDVDVIPIDAGVGVSAAAMRISCTAPTDTSLTFRPEYRREGQSIWTPITVASGTWTVDTSVLPPGIYEVRARFLNDGLLYNLAATITGIDVSLTATAPATPVSFTAVNSSGTVTLQATSPNDAQHKALRFWRNSTNNFATATDLTGAIFTAPNTVTSRTNAPGSGTWYYWATSEFSSTARSTAASAPSITI